MNDDEALIRFISNLAKNRDIKHTYDLLLDNKMFGEVNLRDFLETLSTYESFKKKFGYLFDEEE